MARKSLKGLTVVFHARQKYGTEEGQIDNLVIFNDGTVFSVTDFDLDCVRITKDEAESNARQYLSDYNNWIIKKIRQFQKQGGKVK